MSNWIVKIFPLCAVLISILAYFYPGLFSGFDFMIVPLLGIIMLGMGSTLNFDDFARALKHPGAVVLGIALQFLLMPLLAWCIGKLLQLPQEQFIGLVMVGAVAGGTASNVITYLAGGDVALSITMTACSTAAGIVLTPLLSMIYLQQTIEVPAWSMFKSILLIVALPVISGLLINKLCGRSKFLLDRISPVISAVGIVLVIGIIMSLNAATLQQSAMRTLLAVILHNLSGMAAGYTLARLSRCEHRIALTIAIEVGMQNSGLAAALSKQFFSTAAALPGALFSVWHNISGALFAAWCCHSTAIKLKTDSTNHSSPDKE
ncbi:MAG: bile acid:sodium symporter family protein [Lentisphaerae bacterium]|nr:bile acid:sodium symporter family protein [Lentisphaerota bacterium]